MRVGADGEGGQKVERKAFSTTEFECLLKQTDGSKHEFSGKVWGDRASIPGGSHDSG